MIRDDLVQTLNARTGIAREALETLPTQNLTDHFKASANPALWVAKTMAASPVFLAALYTAGSGRLITAGLMAAAGGYLAFSAKGDYEKNHKVAGNISRDLLAPKVA